ncbi:hypothetical protein [Sphingomonas aerolata]|uniref:hypothetical protein n=1 Tax=Sphingomonas aerolata TaxID=185951 RepID=UPI002FDF1A90
MLIPESVAAYVHDGGVRRAAKEMIRISDGDILDGLDWSELARFYRAQLATRQLECEWAMFGLAVWSDVWGGLLDHWTALSPDEQTGGGYDARLNLASLSDTHDGSLWFGRIFTTGPWTFYASVAAIPMVGLKIKVACQSARANISFKDIAVLPDEVENWTPSMAIPLDTDRIDVGPLRDLARRAVEIADSRGASARSSKARVR